MADAYIVVLDVAVDTVRALLFDSEARRVEGYSAQLPRCADASADCLDEMHRLVHAAGLRIAAVVGRAENEVTAEDRSLWPGFEGAAWFRDLPQQAGLLLGVGCAGGQVAVVLGEASFAGTVDRQISGEGLSCIPIDEKRWMVTGAVPDADTAYVSLRRAIKGSVEEYLETALEDDPVLARLDSAVRGFRDVYQKISGTPPVIGCGLAFLKAPALAQRIADVLGVPLTLSTEPEPGARGAALWALEKIGTIEDVRALPGSTGALFEPKTVAHSE